MRNSSKVKRLLQLHNSLLKMKEWEQLQQAQALQEAQDDLSETLAVLEEAVCLANAERVTGGEALQWRLYLQLLEDKKVQQEQRVLEGKEKLEFSRENTVKAYQEKEKWQLQNDRLKTQSLKALLTHDTKTADDLALQRFSSLRRDK